MREVYVAADMADAELVCNLLRREGLEAVTGRADSNGPPTVWMVAAAEAAEARRLLAGWLAPHPG